MASFPNVLRAVPRVPQSAQSSLLAVSSKRAALSNAAVDVAVVVHIELATLRCNASTSTSSRSGTVVA
jgi:hypothetical protein